MVGRHEDGEGTISRSGKDETDGLQAAILLEEHLDQQKLALLTNQADILQFRMNILVAMMNLREQQSVIKKNDSTTWIAFWDDDDTIATQDRNEGSDLPSDSVLECSKRHGVPQKSAFLQKRRKTDPLTPETIRRVKFLVKLDRSPDLRWSAIAKEGKST